ncbi:MAG: hypothetical protein HYU37_04985 [Acidobacteria bacterium]|nr:hypothetical protein [Acidobacteriota bacterium]
MEHAITLSLRVAICLLIIPTMSVAQEIRIGSDTRSTRNASRATQLARGSRQPAFDINRFRPTPRGTFETFHVTATRPLREAVRTGALQEDTPILLVETAAGKVALLADQMTYHHIAQGRAGNKDWMATF